MHIHHTHTHILYLILYLRYRWDPLISIHAPHAPISFSIFLCVCVCFGAALYELEKEPAYWDAQARATLDAALKLRPRDHQAKNIILFLGDGRSSYHYGIYSGIHSSLTWSRSKHEQEKATTFSFTGKRGSTPNARQCSSVLKCVQSHNVFAVLGKGYEGKKWLVQCVSSGAGMCRDLLALMSQWLQ